MSLKICQIESGRKKWQKWRQNEGKNYKIARSILQFGRFSSVIKFSFIKTKINNLTQCSMGLV